MREQTPFTLYATGDILDVLAQNRIFDAVSREKVPRERVMLNTDIPLLPGHERAKVLAAGWTIAQDGQEITP